MSLLQTRPPGFIVLPAFPRRPEDYQHRETDGGALVVAGLKVPMSGSNDAPLHSLLPQPYPSLDDASFLRSHALSHTLSFRTIESRRKRRTGTCWQLVVLQLATDRDRADDLSRRRRRSASHRTRPSLKVGTLKGRSFFGSRE